MSLGFENIALMIFILGLILALLISYLIADAYCGGWDKSLLRTTNFKSSFKLVITPYQKRVLKLSIMLSPLVLFLEVILYWLWLRDIIFRR